MYISAFFCTKVAVNSNKHRLIKALMHTHFYQIYRRRVSDERQDFWCFTASWTKLHAPDRNPSGSRTSSWYRKFFHQCNND